MIVVHHLRNSHLLLRFSERLSIVVGIERRCEPGSSTSCLVCVHCGRGGSGIPSLHSVGVD